MADKGFSFEKAFKKTDVGAIEVKEIPPSRLLETASAGRYFDNNDGLFMELFRYIRQNGVSMTVPVEADLKDGAMRFYVGTKDADRDLPDAGKVRVKEMPMRQVVSLGARGTYSEKNFKEAEKKLLAWFAKNDQHRPSAPAYAVFWDGPYKPGFLKRFEVHVPVN